MELSQDPGAFSDVIGLSVCDGSGRRIGRVYEVRAHWDGDGRLVFDDLLIGRGALWRRLRGPGPEATGVPWENVVEVSRERIVVRR